MNLQEMFEKVMVDSGQFLIPAEGIELKEQNFKILVQTVIGKYNGYVPIDYRKTIDVTGTRQFTFNSVNSPEGIPDYISEILPIKISGVYPFYLNDWSPGVLLQPKSNYPYQYRKPTLVVPVEGQYEIHAARGHVIEGTGSSEDPWRVDTIDHNADEFFNLMVGKFLIALGRSRNAFTIQDIPITMDSSEMIAEGKELDEKADQDMTENKMKWWLAWG